MTFIPWEAYAAGTVVMLALVLLSCMQGIELQNPTAHLQQQDVDMRSGTESYFSEYSGFRSIKQKQPPPTFG